MKETVLPSNSKKILIYYFIYSFVFVLVHLGMISIFSFFHFLLDHDLNTIEGWLSLNAWEILVASKIISFSTIFYFLKMNNYKNVGLKSLLKPMEIIPHKKILGVIVFLLISFHFYMSQLGGAMTINEVRSDYLYVSFFCSALLFIVDFSMIYVLEYFYQPIAGSFKIRLISLLFLFLISIKITQPFSSGIYFVLLIHFVSMYYFCRKKHFGNGLLYSLFVISPLSAFYGLDIVWNNSHSLVGYESEVPVIGIIGIWSLALSYFHYSRID